MVMPKKPFQALQEPHLAVDVYQSNGNIVAKMDLPGIDPNDIRVEIEDGQLHVFGECKEKEGFFDRLMSLPAGIDKAGMSYEIKDGVLTVIIPKE